MAVPYTFGTATSSIPLSQLDSNFATVITLGNTAIQLGNTVTTLNNMTLANVTISSGNITLTNVSATTANVTTANITTAVIGTETVTTSTITSANITTANVTTANITTGNVTTGTVSTSLTLSYGTANAVAYLNGSKVVTTGSALTFDGTNFATTGTATAAKLIPTGSSATGNGLYLPAANALGLSTNGTNAVYIDASQNVGIGTSSPSYKLDVSMALGSAVSTGLRLTNTNTNGYGAGLRIDVSPTAAGQYTAGFINVENSTGTSTDGGRLKFYTAAEDVSHTLTERMRIDSSGNLLVGTTSFAYNPTQGATIAGGSIGAVGIGHASGTATGNGYVNFAYNGSNIGSITQSGTTAVLYNVTSDQRLKENIVDAPEFGSVIDSIKVRSYDWKADGNHQRAGFVAQELATVAPEAVHQPADPEEMMAVDYSKLVPMLVKEIQSLRKRLAALESR